MSQKAAIRRRKQHANNFAHLAPKQRPNYKKRSAEASARRLAKAIATEQRIRQKKKQK